MKKKLSVTIGIPAYNEEANIANLLRSLLKQKSYHVRITEILVYSDGSNDGTVENARKVKDDRIHIHDSHKRLGKPYRLNQIFNQSKSDIIVLVDADTLPVTDDVVDNVCQPFLDPNFSGLTSGRRKGLPSRSLTAKALSQLNDAYEVVRKNLRNGKNLYAFLAGIVAVDKQTANLIKFKTDMNCDDNFLYLTALNLDKDLKYIPEAQMWYNLPNNPWDQIKQGGRFLSSQKKMSVLFNPKTIKSEYHVPLALQKKIFRYQISHNPLAYVWLKLLAIPCELYKRKFITNKGSLWSVSNSTKIVSI